LAFAVLSAYRHGGIPEEKKNAIISIALKLIIPLQHSVSEVFFKRLGIGSRV